MIDKYRLKHISEQYDIKLDDEMLAKFTQYARLLDDWNQKMNLTTIVKPEEVEIKHFLDCLLLAAQPDVRGRFADVGSGAGFPGLVIKIYKPQVSVTLIEPTGKRARFLQTAADTLGLQVAVVNRRAEEVGRKELREQFDCISARAVAAMPALCEYCLPLVRVGGVFIAMKGGEEPLLSPDIPAKLGGDALQSREFTLPDGSRRKLIFISKNASTLPQYPRNGGVIVKRPLGAK